MREPKKQTLSFDEQQVLDQLQAISLDESGDRERCDELIAEHHYLKDATLVGEQLRYAAVFQGQWFALATWSAAALHVKVRDQFIGWTAEQCRQRRSLIANNSRLLVLPDCHYPNLISRFMKLMLARLSADWEERWKHPLAMVETFVDSQLFQGTAYKASGWSHLGGTAGWKRNAADFYLKHDQPKQVWVKELTRRAGRRLKAEKLPAKWASAEANLIPRCSAKVKEMLCLMDHLRTGVPEFRRAQALAYPVAGLAALAVMAIATGVRKGPDDLAAYAQTLSQGQLRALRFRRFPQNQRIRCPGKTVFHTFLSSVDAEALERSLVLWQNQVLGPAKDKVILIDGKKMRGGGCEIVNATTGAGRFLASQMTPDKTNEIPTAQAVLQPIDLAGKLVVADALHTQLETAQQIVHEQGGDYLMTVKGNQPTLQKTLQTLFEKQGFSPCACAAHSCPDPGAEPGPG